MPANTSVAPAPTGAAEAAADERSVVALLVALIVTAMLPLGHIVAVPADQVGNPNFRTSVFLFDAVLACVALVALARRPVAVSLRDRVTMAALAVVALEAVSFLVHPSSRGVELLLRFVGVGAVVACIAGLREERSRRIVLAAIVAVGAAEAVLGMAQSALGHTVGLDNVEYHGKLYTFGSSHAGRGSLDHPYHLATLLVVALAAAVLGAHRSRRLGWWAAGAAVCAAGLAITYSRAGVFSLVPLVTVLGIAALRRPVRAERIVAIVLTAAVVGGFAFGALGFGDGWRAKSDATVHAGNLDSATTGRTDRWKEATRLIRRDPVTGVGVGNYVFALRHVQHSDVLPSHDAVLDITAESGVVAGAVALALLAGLAWRSWRAGLLGIAVFVTLTPYLLLDSYPTSFPVGLVITSLWAGLLVLAWRSPEVAP